MDLSENPNYIAFYCKDCKKRVACEFFVSSSGEAEVSEAWRSCRFVKRIVRRLLCVSQVALESLLRCDVCKNGVWVKDFNGVYVCEMCYVACGGSVGYWRAW